MTAAVRTTWHAAKTGDLALLQELIEVDGSAFDEPDGFDATPFKHACLFGHPRAVQYLLGLYEKHDKQVERIEWEVCIRGCTNDELRKFLCGHQTMEETLAACDELTRVANMSIWEAARTGNYMRLRAEVQYHGHISRRELIAELDDAKRSAMSYACENHHITTVATLLPNVQGVLKGDALEAELDACRAVTTNDIIMGLLNGTVSIKEAMKLGRPIPPHTKKVPKKAPKGPSNKDKPTE